MKQLILILIAAMLLLGCTQQVKSLPNVTIPGGQVNTTPPTGGQNDTGQQNTTPPQTNQTPQLSQYVNYDLKLDDVSLNTTSPVVSYYSTLTVKVSYEGGSKPSKYKVTYYDNNNLVEAKTVNAPKEQDVVTFNWLPVTDGTHQLRFVVDSLDEVKTEDGPKTNNEMSKSYDVLPIELLQGSAGEEVSKQYWHAQQFMAPNRIGINTIAVNILQQGAPDDVQMVLELREDDFNKPGRVVTTNRFSIKNFFVGQPQWVTVNYGTNGVFLTKNKYWIVLYLDDDSTNRPVWVATSSNAYDGKSMVVDKNQGTGVSWTDLPGDFLFKVSTNQ